jgi:flagellar hook-basal body complex protein FliE
MTIPVSGLGSALGQWTIGPKQAGATDPTGGFGSMLSDAIGSLEHTQDVAAQQSRALATGETQDISSVVAAVQEASLSMQLAAQVRNKAVEAYTEIFHTQI